MRLLLQSHGIETTLRNEFIQGATGQVPLIDAWPELWLSNETHAESAMQLVRDALAEPPSDLANWRCAQCGEDIEGQFTGCWQCGATRA
jgi:hypothetical protein